MPTIKIIINLTLRVLNYYLSTKFNTLKQETTLNQVDISLPSLFNLSYNAYSKELKEKGVVGV